MKAADQVAVEHAQDAALGTGDPGAARQRVGGLAHPGEPRAPGLAVDGEEDEDVADMDALVGRAVVLGQQVSAELDEGRALNQCFRPYIFAEAEGLVIDGAGEGGVRGRGGPGGVFAAAMEESGDDTTVGQGGASMRRRREGDAYGLRPCAVLQVPTVQADALERQLVRTDPGGDGEPPPLPVFLQRRRPHISVEGGEQERQAGALVVVDAKQLWVQIVDKRGRVEGEKCAGL
ncbi:hypothetical protein PG991_009258 [Apiospora marii]|uniref:Uncharacterized protein n=1 Tax=Apiospora marii TaxID=335849 RepID=A0ABR1RK48_9PEZI